MRNAAWRGSMFFVVTLSLALKLSFALVPPEKIQKENQIKSVVQDVFREHGYTIEKSNVVLIDDGGKLTVAMDVSDSIASTLSDEILDRIVGVDLSLLDTTLEMNIFGAAVGVRDEQIRKNAIDPNWKDALSSIRTQTLAEKNDVERISNPAMVTSEGLWSGPQNSQIEKARSIILVHLLKIRQAGEMLNTVLMETYWRDVFSQSHASDLFDIGRPLISDALAAGVKPYREGKTLNAATFADLALGALGMQTASGSGASVILFRP